MDGDAEDATRMKEPESCFYYQGKANRIWSLPFLEIPGILGDSKHIVTGRGVVGMMFLALASLHLINALDCPERLRIVYCSRDFG